MATSIKPEDRRDLLALFDANAPIKKILERAEGSIASAVRGPVGPEVLIRAAILQVSMTPALQECNKLSIVQAVMQAASIGLMIGGPTGEAALVPRKNRAVLTPMVRGLVTLGIRSGFLKGVTPVAVYEGDEFKVRRGTENNGQGTIVHEPDLDADREDDSKIRYVYAVFQLPDGAITFDFMNRKEIERVRAVSAAAQSKDGPWVNWWVEQAKKTVVKRGSKLIPLSPEFRAAVELDNRLETGKINEPSDLLDAAEDITEHVRQRTQDRTDDLRDRMAGERPAVGPGAAQPVAAASSGDARPVARNRGGRS